MRAYIFTDAQARRVPLTLLLCLCAAYLLPGFTSREPWGSADATGFGIALTFASGSLSDWLSASVFGLPLPDEAPLSYWLIAAGIRFTDPWLSAHAAARLTTGLLVAAGLMAMWRAIFLLARRPEVLPSDPFGASAPPALISRSMADTGVLVLLACCGLIIRLHETTADAIQFTWTALLLLGFAVTLRRPQRGGLITGLALVATALGTSPLLASLLGAAWLFAHLISAPLRALAHQSIPSSIAVIVAATVLGASLMTMADPVGRASVAEWWFTSWPPLGASVTSWADRLQILAWFVWPAWPLALWTLWAWRSLWREPAVIVPLLSGIAVLAYLAIQPRLSEQAVIPLALPLTMLAIWGLPTMARGFASLLDWLAVALFSLFLVFILGYWLALQTGFPTRMALSAARVAPGFQSEHGLSGGVIALFAIVGWLALIRWRLSRGPRVLWRPVVLSAGGLTITWLLLVSLWLPIFDDRTSLRAAVNEASALIHASTPDSAVSTPCAHAVDLGPGDRMAFAYFGGLRFAREGEVCNWVIRRPGAPTGVSPDDSPARWERVWQGGRRIDRMERLILERRVP
jgi:hypothetical protein